MISLRNRHGFIKLLLSTAVVLSSLCVLAPSMVTAAPPGSANDVCSGVGLIDSSGNCTDPATSGNQLNNTVSGFISILSIIIGLAAIIMLMIGGARYITSGGEPAKIAAAKNTVIYAIIGLVVVALAQFIVRFVLSKLP